MEITKFDALVRALASGLTRRAALGALIGLTGIEVYETASKRRQKHNRGKRKKDRKKSQRTKAEGANNQKVGVCHHTGSETNPLVFIEVSENAVEAHNAHGDATGVDLQTDPNNCGTCGNVCPGDACNTAVCENGQCGTEPVVCDDSDPCTTDSCVLPGGCVFTDVECPRDQVCVGGECECSPDLPECAPRFERDPDTCECFCPIDSCPDGEILDPEACECIPEPFFCREVFVCGEEEITCGPAGSDCLCGPTIEGFDRCGNNFVCGTTAVCSSTAECEALFGAGYACRREGFGCCEGSPGVCRPPCGTTTLGIAANGSQLTDSGR